MLHPIERNPDGTLVDNHINTTYNPPEWATHLIGADEYDFVEGTVLCTRDGRKTGNGVIMDIEKLLDGRVYVYLVVTDAGNVLRASPQELTELFHHPVWVCNPVQSPAWHAYVRKHP